MRKNYKKKARQLCIMGMMVLILGGCGKSDSIKEQEKQASSTNVKESQEETVTANKEAITTNEKKSDSGTDQELGFKSKSYEDFKELTEGQKKVQQYFNTDYFSLNEYEYEFLQRYPDVFEGTELKMNGTIENILSTDGNQFEMLVWIGENIERFIWGTGEDEVAYEAYKQETQQNLVVIKGEYGEARWIEGDEIAFTGTYQDIQSYDIDGKNHQVPVINVSDVYIDADRDLPVLYDVAFIKEVAKNIFGEDIMITQGNDYDRDNFEDYYKNNQDYWKQILNGWYYTCELDNQSNAKFSKYYFFSQFGVLMDAKSTDAIQRKIEFAPDFQHFFLLIADNQLNTLTLEYYDKDLNKIWKQEFEETVSATYDYTSTHVYVVVNNELHIFDITTGEETTEPSFVGDKGYMRKLKDGILVLDGSSTADSIMKIDLNGKIQWKMNTEGIIQAADVQVVDDRIILYMQLYVESKGTDMRYMAIDSETGELIKEAESLTN